MIKSYWTYKYNNFGDLLTPDIVEWVLGEKVEHVPEDTHGKLLAVGSIMEKLRKGDTVWGTGVHVFKNKMKCEDVTFLAVRGPLTRGKMLTIYDDVPTVYGDAALLLPRMYAPTIEKKYRIGYVPHQVDVKVVRDIINSLDLDDVLVIDPTNENWRETVDKILSCETIISSSLHGVIAAEAYGIPAMWSIHSDKIFGGEFKYMDYYMATGRPTAAPYVIQPPIPNLTELQDELIRVLKEHYENR